MKVRRDISSIPQRSAEETWQTIVALVTGLDSVDAAQFDAAATVMASLIADEEFKSEPLVLTGVSHRLVIYLKYAQDALEHGNNVDKLAWNPTAGDWTLYVPCSEEQLDWAKKTLSSRAPRFVVHKYGDAPQEEAGKAQKNESLTINWGAVTQ